MDWWHYLQTGQPQKTNEEKREQAAQQIVDLIESIPVPKYKDAIESKLWREKAETISLMIEAAAVMLFESPRLGVILITELVKISFALGATWDKGEN